MEKYLCIYLRKIFYSLICKPTNHQLVRINPLMVIMAPHRTTDMCQIDQTNGLYKSLG